ncbi:AsnC family transcriptional regulator [Streptomyces sp. NPDC004012]
MNQLAYDGRASHQALADALSTSASTVKRRMDQLTRLGLLRLRCDFARPLGGWPVGVTFWATVPTADLADIGHDLIRLPQTRNCAAISGPHNLVLQAALHSVEDVLYLEHQIATTCPSLEIADRVITLRYDKIMGHVLDPYGRSVGVVPPDVWSDPADAAPGRTDRR